ncbi:MAG TPA: glycosyltransferase [Acidimicrobiales bacterium]|nr:glycosyltransferase [Acidimicrobiales bacterium]
MSESGTEAVDAPRRGGTGSDVSVVIMTRNRCQSLSTTLGHLAAMPERPPVVVVDNGSTDDTARVVAGAPDARLVRLATNEGVGARNIGVDAVSTPYIAFCDDDSWWAPGSLRRAAQVLDAHPRLGAVTAHVLVGPDERDDPTSLAMANGPLPPVAGLPGVPVGGFLACAVVVRREAFLDVGGFHRAFQIGGEEALLAIDLLDAGWALHYLPDVVVHHHPVAAHHRSGRRRRQLRNDLWTLWLRRPAGPAARQSVTVLRGAGMSLDTAGGAAAAVRGLPWVLRNRRRARPSTEVVLRALDEARA